MDAIDRKSLLQGLCVSVPLGIAMIELQPFGADSIAAPLLVFALGGVATLFFLRRNKAAGRETTSKRDAYWDELNAGYEKRRAFTNDLIARGFIQYIYRPCDPRVYDVVTFASVHSEQVWDAAPNSLDPRMNADGLFWRPVDYADFEELPPQRVISHSLH